MICYKFQHLEVYDNKQTSSNYPLKKDIQYIRNKI